MPETRVAQCGSPRHDGGAVTVGIVGAGRMGLTLAGLASTAEVRVLMTSRTLATSSWPSGHSLEISFTDIEDMCAAADVVILAVPFQNLELLDARAFDGALVVDAMNRWGASTGYETANDSPLRARPGTSELVQRHLDRARVVKGFNHLSYRDLGSRATPCRCASRLAIPIAGDFAADLDVVSGVVDAFGFDPVVVGDLREGRRIEPRTAAFGLLANARTMREATMQPTADSVPAVPDARVVAA